MRGGLLLPVLGVLAAFYFAEAVFLTIAVSFFVAVLLEPLAALLAVRLGRKWGVSLSTAAFVAVALAASWGCWQPLARIYVDIPRYSAKLHSLAGLVQTHLSNLEAGTEGFQAPRKQGEKEIQKVEIVGGESSWSHFLLRSTSSVFQIFGIVVFVPFLAAFGLMEKDALLRGFEALWRDAQGASRLYGQIGPMVRAYFLGSLMAGVGLAAAQWILFASLGLENAAGLGLLTGFANIVPLAGLPAAIFVAAAQALLQFDHPLPFAVLILGLTTLHFFAQSIVIPRFIASRVRLNSTAATLALLFWGWLWGVVGFLMAVPLTALLKIFLDNVPGGEPGALLLGDAPRKRLNPAFSQTRREESRVGAERS